MSTRDYPANPSSNPLLAPAEEMNEFYEKASMIMRRIMNCVTIDDPNVRHIVASDSDLEMAMFMSKALVSSIMTYTKSKENGQNPAAATTAGTIQSAAPSQILVITLNLYQKVFCFQ